MGEQDSIERLSDAIDRIVLEGNSSTDADEELAPLVALAVDLGRAMPPVRANPAFETGLRARLLTNARPSPLERLLRRMGLRHGMDAAPVHGTAAPPRRVWGYAFATAAAAVIVAAALLTFQAGSPDMPGPVAAQPAREQATTAPAAAAQPRIAAAPTAEAGYTQSDQPSNSGEASPERATAALAAPMAAASKAGAAGAAAATAGEGLPALPPLAASSPPASASGMGGAGTDQDAPSRQISFELTVPLPDLAPEAVVYRYEQPARDEGAIEDLAARLGFEPSEMRSIAGAKDFYVVTDPIKGTLEIDGQSGVIIYRSAVTGNKPKVQTPPPSDAVALKAANDWLRNAGLMPAGAGDPEVALPYSQASSKEVTFQPAEPANIVTPNPRASVSVDGDGQVVEAYLLWPQVESTVEYPARPPESAWELLEAGKAEMRFEGEHNRPDLDLTVRVTSIETGYAITYGLDDRPYLQPVVLFRGGSSAAGDARPSPFTGWVPAVADSAISQGNTHYVLATSLPETPAQLSALQPIDDGPTEEWVRQQALRLGLSDEPRLVDEGERRFWEVRDRAGEWVLQVPAGAKAQAGASERWSFGRIGQDLTGLGKAPTGEDAVEIATNFLKNHELYTPDLGPARAEQAAPDGSATIVIFQGNDPWTPAGERGVLSITINGQGQLHRVMSNQRRLKAIDTAPAISPQEALERVQAGEGRLDVPSLPGRAIYSDNAQIEKVELVYQPEMAPGEAQDPATGLPRIRYEPNYAFSGMMEVGESRLQLPFTVSLSAWAH